MSLGQPMELVGQKGLYADSERKGPGTEKQVDRLLKLC